jgi:AmmeMemoRadiSam system protein B
MVSIRRPVAYGFYPPQKEALEEALRACFLDRHGPGRIPTVASKRQGKVVGAVTPHAGYVYSGPIAAHTYEALALDGLPETFVLIGPKHGYMRFEGAATMTTGAWATPLGDCPIDTRLAETLVKCGGTSDPRCIVESDQAHEEEHSLEVQLPFLQFLCKKKPVQIVPLVISTSSYSTCERVGEAMANAISQSGRSVAILASTDFTHYGKYFYQYAPVGSGPIDKVVRWIYETDGDLIRKIEEMDGKALLTTVVQEGRTMCGSSAVATMLVAARRLGAVQGKLLKYATSYDVRGSTDAIVGYGAIAVGR